MTNIRINEVSKTIEVTKKFYNAACRFGTDEFRALQEVRSYFPSFKTVIRRTKANDSYKGLTYAYMENYIKNHDEDGAIWSDYQMLRGKSEDGAEFISDKKFHYGEIKKWFLTVYPEFDEFNTSRKNKLAGCSLKVVA